MIATRVIGRGDHVATETIVVNTSGRIDHSKNPKNETAEAGWPPQMGAPATQKVASADRMGPTPRCIHSSGATRSSLVKIWSLNDENTQLSTCGAGNAVIARSSLPTITLSVAYQMREECIRTDDIVREVVQVLELSTERQKAAHADQERVSLPGRSCRNLVGWLKTSAMLQYLWPLRSHSPNGSMKAHSRLG